MIANRRDRVMWMNDCQTHILDDRPEIVALTDYKSAWNKYIHVLPARWGNGIAATAKP